MTTFNAEFREEMKQKLGVELLGAASVETGTPILKEKATTLLPGAKSVLVFAKEIYREVVSLLRPSKGVGEADPGELLGPHSEFLNGRLSRAVYEMADLLRKKGFRCLPLPAAGCPMDQRSLTAIFSFKHAAVAAGLGTMGRHSMVITPEFGPRVRLACLLTDAGFDPSPVNPKSYCVNCDACIKACPARALQKPAPMKDYEINPYACRNYRGTGLTCAVCLKACDEVLI